MIGDLVVKRGKFRFMEESDIDAVMVLVADYSRELSGSSMRRAKRTEYRRYLHETPAAPDHFVLLLELEDAICGFVDYRTELCRQDNRMTFGEVVEFYIVPSCRHRGLGRRLARRAVEHLDALGADLVNLSVLTTNPTGDRFWASLGFRDHCIRKRLYL